MDDNGNGSQDRATGPPPVDDLVTAVLTASRVLVAISVSSLAEIEDAVTLTQFRALVVLGASDQVNLNRLAESLGVNASTAMRTVDRLLAAGLVTRRENPSTRREVLLGLTPEGARLVRQATERRRDELARIVRKMAATRRSELVQALVEFTDAAGEPRTIASVGW